MPERPNRVRHHTVLPLNRVKAPPSRRHVQQKSGGRKPRGETGVQVLQLFYDLLGGLAVDVTEGPAAEGREADPEHRADVAVAWGPQHAFLEAEHRFIDHRENAAL